MRPAKQWGQNFVVDSNTVRKIVRVAGVGEDDVVVEVGPGLGSHSLALLPSSIASPPSRSTRASPERSRTQCVPSSPRTPTSCASWRVTP